MVGLGECRSACIDGLPWQLRLLPTGYCNMRRETERSVIMKRSKARMSVCSVAGRRA